MSSPARIAWKRNTEWIASRMAALPRKENERLLIPPLTRACGSSRLMKRTVSIKSSAYLRCSSIPVPTGKTLGSKMMSSGANPPSRVSSS